MTSGFRFSLLNLGSRYAPNQRVLITNHLAWSRERGEVANRDNALLNAEPTASGPGMATPASHGCATTREKYSGFWRSVPAPAPGRHFHPVRLHACADARAGLFRGTGHRMRAATSNSPTDLLPTGFA